MWGSCLEGDVATLKCLPIVINNVINFALAFSGTVALVIVIYAAYKYISSRGDQAKIDEAKKTLTYALIGMVFIFGAFFIVKLIADLTGASQIANPTL